MRVVGIAGTAKNTGKTTTTVAILEQGHAHGLTFGLTSIGYDGEEIDNVTGLPKPRLNLRQGSLVAVASRCLQASPAQVKVLQQTNIKTPLGNIVIGEVVKEGLLVVAGPNKSRELRQVIELLKSYDVDLILVDGALNRIAPMVETEGFILATGASRNANIPLLVHETRCIVQLLGVPEVEFPTHSPLISVFNDHGVQQTLEVSSLFNKDTARDVVRAVHGQKAIIYIPGVVSIPGLEELVSGIGKEWAKVTLCFQDAIKIILGGHPCEILKLLNRIKELGGRVGVVKRVPILAVTVNPFYPRYRYDTSDYQPAFVDQEQLYKTMVKAVQVPVFDVVKQGGQELLQKMLAD